MVPRPVRFGRETCGDLERAEALEWLVTNGAGGFASGTVAGPRTRRYHGLLVAALDPPAARTVMVAEVHEVLELPDGQTPLHASRWRDGSVSPRGYEHTEAFWLEGTVPVWRFCVGEFALEKRVFMAPGKNATVVSYRLARGPRPTRLAVKVLAGHRDFHSTTHAGGWRMEVTHRPGEVRVVPYAGGRSLRITSGAMALTSAHSWYEGFLLRREQDRGLETVDDSLHVATATVVLTPGAEVSLVFSAEPDDVEPGEVLREVVRREGAVVERYRAQQGPRADEIGARLALAADQFLVRRNVAGHEGSSVIAGYHWFGDWGRDTMISLPGLTLSTGRADLARDILLTYARFVDAGMLPNRFPDAAGPPEYNTVDATLWYLEAVRAYVEATGDVGLARELWPVLEQIVAAHEQGTRYGIAVDPTDGLLRSGEAGVQLTWMDAKVGDWVVTPRTGKCVEINALWFNGLVALAELSKRLGRDEAPWRQRASRVRSSMQRFWCAETGYLFDVLDGPSGADRSLRPNQIFAVSLAACAFEPEQQRAVVDVCGSALLTSHGLRSLAPTHPDYCPHYGGDPRSRDGAYHQGTVWGWLLGPFALAHLRVYGDVSTARSFLEPLVDHLVAHGVGTVAEIFDGAAPHLPRGCIAQAWSVAELLRAWVTISSKEVAS
ncbi:MAG: glycogen debranching enzyme family protein [Deltaproteobacteria bacterium]|nr:glycogen debranching enzyme family protein [Deltaproteobacteria bacterium]